MTTGLYSRQHASALRQVTAKGARVTFTSPDAAAYAPSTDTFGTPNMSTVSGYAVRVVGNPRTYERLSLIQSESPSLLFVPDTYGAVAALDSTVTWSGRTWTVKDVTTISPDGTSIAQEIIITGGAVANISGVAAAVFTYAITAAGGITFTGTSSVSPAFAVAGVSDYSLVFRYQPGDSLAGATATRASSGTQVDANGIVQTASTNVARDGHYIGGVRTLLLEGQRTNLCPHSSDLTSTDWSKTRSSALLNATGPDGVVNSASTLTEDATAANTHTVTLLTTVTKAASSLPYTSSVFLKANGRTRCQLQMQDGSGNGQRFEIDLGAVTATVGTSFGAGWSVPSCTITALAATGWYRVTWTATSNAATTLTVLLLLEDASGATSYNGDGASGMRWYGCQIEQASFVSSYIATTTTAVTRSDDVFSSPFLPVPQVQTMYAKLIVTGNGTGAKWRWVLGRSAYSSGATGASDRCMALLIDDTSKPRISVNDGTGGFDLLATPTVAIGDTLEIAGSWAVDGSLALSGTINGTPFSTTGASGKPLTFGAWAAQIHQLQTSNNFGAHQSLKIALGVRSLAQMQAA